MLVERGCAATILALIPDEAGVSSPTAYKAFRNKPGLLKGVFEYAVVRNAHPGRTGTPTGPHRHRERTGAETARRGALQCWCWWW